MQSLLFLARHTSCYASAPLVLGWLELRKPGINSLSTIFLRLTYKVKEGLLSPFRGGSLTISRVELYGDPADLVFMLMNNREEGMIVAAVEDRQSFSSREKTAKWTLSFFHSRGHVEVTFKFNFSVNKNPRLNRYSRANRRPNHCHRPFS